MNNNPFVRARLYCPGPTPVPHEVSAAALQTNIYHRSEAFRQLLQDCRVMLQIFFGSVERPLILTCSGTGAMEAAMLNLTQLGDKILVIVAGKFGERWEKLASTYQCQIISYTVPWGQSPDTTSLKALLTAHPDCKAVFFQANETSTKITFPIN